MGSKGDIIPNELQDADLTGHVELKCVGFPLTLIFDDGKAEAPPLVFPPKAEGQ